MENSELQVALKDLLTEFHVGEHAEEVEKETDKEVRTWLAAAALKIWSANKLLSESYIDSLNTVMEERYTIAQVDTALSCAGEPDREISVPKAFQEIVEKDIERHTDLSRRLIDTIGSFLMVMAFSNGDFTMEEANALHGICNTLSSYCDYHQIRGKKSFQDYFARVTPINAAGYYQKSAEVHEIAESDAKPVQASDEKNGGSLFNTCNINLNFKVGADDQEDSGANSLQNDSPNPGVVISGGNRANTGNSNTGNSNTQKNNSQNPGIQNSNMQNPDTARINVGKSDDNNSDIPDTGAEEETLESVLAELDSLVGLETVKNDVHSLMNFIKISQLRAQRGMKVPTVSYHLVFTGNPGTGKTTVARMVAKLYYLMGILPQGQLVETDRSGLVAGYLGQTAIKTQKVIQEALGGVLFIDEAYSLVNDDNDSYGKEAIETILKAMEDHRNELVVIVAGYDDLMHRFIDSNPGLKSRFNKYFQFPDYDGEDLLRILKRFCDTNGYELADNAVPVLQEKLHEVFEHRDEHFGNARSVRNLFEQAINHQADRLVLENDLTDQALAELTKADILPALEAM